MEKITMSPPVSASQISVSSDGATREQGSAPEKAPTVRRDAFDIDGRGREFLEFNGKCAPCRRLAAVFERMTEGKVPAVPLQRRDSKSPKELRLMRRLPDGRFEMLARGKDAAVEGLALAGHTGLRTACKKVPGLDGSLERLYATVRDNRPTIEQGLSKVLGPGPSFEDFPCLDERLLSGTENIGAP